MAYRRSNPLALAILIYLQERPRHPYELAAELRYRHAHEAIKLNFGTLYSVIESLEHHGLISAERKTREGRRPERTIYDVTDTGRAEAADWLATLLAVPEKEYLRFEAGLSLMAALPPESVAELLQQRLGLLEQRIRAGAELAAQRDPATLPRLFILEAEYSAALLATEHAFVTALLEELESGAFEGLVAWQSWHEADRPEPSPTKRLRRRHGDGDAPPPSEHPKPTRRKTK